MRYDFILFDADGTLMDFHRSEAEAIRIAMEKMGIEPSDLLVSEYSKINESLWKMLERKEITKPELLVRRFEIFCERFSFSADPKEMAETYIEALSQRGYLFDGAEELCRKLSKSFSLYIVTNGVESIQKGRFSRVPLHKYVKDVFISGAIGYEKPDVRYFEAVADKIKGFDKKRALIVGDSLSADILGGINFGIDTCFYDPQKKPVPAELKITYVAESYADVYDIIIREDA